MSTPSILVSGASIAGPTAASWLAAAGWDVTVVERFDHLRDEGQNVDLRGTGREIVRRMGLEDAARSHHTSETGTALVDEDGRAYATWSAGAEDARRVSSPTAELEILRGQLARLLYDHSASSADYLFGDRITALHDDGRGVDVEFAHGASRRFDAVVIAEGARSRTRELVIPGAQVDELGYFVAYATIPRTADDDRQWRMHLAGKGRVVHLRPDNVGSTRAMLSLKSDVRGLDRLDRDGVVAVMRATYGDAGWETRASSPPSTTPRSTSTRSPRSAFPPGIAGVSSCSATPPGARARSAPGRRTRSPGRTCSPASWAPPRRTSRRRSHATSTSCAHQPTAPRPSSPTPGIHAPHGGCRCCGRCSAP
jgi:2-polyprenyl-6-methoxyphenol hydroxylase-like FAD-dependent oxidoreductase